MYYICITYHGGPSNAFGELHGHWGKTIVAMATVHTKN